MRFAWSVTWGILAVLFLALWLRSYQILDNIAGHLPRYPAVAITSANGRIVFGARNDVAPWKWNVHSDVLDAKSFGGRPTEPRTWFIVSRTPADTAIQVPHWFVVLLTALPAITPSLLLRFRLRSLLVATSLIAVAIGLILWATR